MRLLFVRFCCFVATIAHVHLALPATTYFANGGMDYVVIEEPVTADPEPIETSLSSASYGFEGAGYTATHDGDFLIVTELPIFQVAGNDSPSTFSTQLWLKPAPGNPSVYNLHRRVYSFSPDVRVFDPPLPYLHRAAHAEVAEYYRGAGKVHTPAPNGVTTEGLISLAERVLEKEPQNRFYRLLVLDALMRAEKFVDLGSRFAGWESDFEKSDDPFVRSQGNRMRKVLEWHELESTGRNGHHQLRKALARTNNLDTMLRELPQLLQYEQCRFPPAIILRDMPGEPNYLLQQVVVKVVRVVAVFRLLQADRASALELLCASYRMGQFLSADYYSIQRLIGAAFRSLATDGLVEYVLNACETEEEVLRAWKALEELHAVDRQAEHDADHELVALDDLMNPRELNVRKNLAHAKFAILRTAAAARLAQVRTGLLPRTPEELSPLLPGGLPADPFSSEPLRLLPGPLLSVYSMGPDRRDDSASVLYDPTNGTVSPGDIVTTLPVTRKYPYPRQPLTAKFRMEVNALFPKGVSVDPFNDRRGDGLRVTHTTPVMIYSVGPDTDDQRIRPVETFYVPTVSYDPTNGVVSRGDLFMVLPEE